MEKFEAALARLENYVYSLGALPIYVYLPLSSDLILEGIVRKMGEDPADYDISIYFNLLKAHCEKQKIQLVNTAPVLKKYHDQGHLLSFLLDGHYNAFANRLIGEYLYREIFHPDSGT
jgi:hypothetical protein